MYEQPQLNAVGKASDVILGVASWGDDLDGLIIAQHQEFAEDSLITTVWQLLRQLLGIL